MATPAEVLKIKLTRKRLLSFMNMMYPTPLQLQTLCESVSYVEPTYDPSLFQKDIIYFKDKGYVEFVDEKIGGAPSFMQKVVKLTAKGKEIAEQTQTDPALEI